MSHTTAAQNATIEELLDQFCHHPEAHDKSPYFNRIYPGLHQFANWSTESTGEPLALEAVTKYDVRDHLASTMEPATVNRKLASLSDPYHRAGETEQSERDPTRYVNGIKQRPMAPKALSKAKTRFGFSGQHK